MEVVTYKNLRAYTKQEEFTMNAFKSLSLSLVAATALAGCSNNPTIPESAFNTVEQNIQMAKEDNAYKYAPLAINSAEQNYEDAKRAVQKDDMTTAKMKLEKATVDSEYALALTDAEKAKLASKEVSQGLRSLENSN